MSTRKPAPAPATNAKAEEEKDKAGATNTENNETAKVTGDAETTKNNNPETGGEANESNNQAKAPETAENSTAYSKETKDEEGGVAEVVDKKVKLVKIKFIKAHTFYIGTDKIEAKPNDIKMVEPHTANKLLARSIAYILG